MMNLKAIILLSVILLLPAGLLRAQDDAALTEPRTVPPRAIQKDALKKGAWHLSLGSSVMYSPQLGSLSGFSVTPVFSLPLSQRLSLHGGASLTRFSGPYMPFTNEQGNLSAAGGTVALFGSASYKVNENIILYGEGTKYLGKLPVQTPFSPYMSDNLTIGSMFKIGDHLTIGASFRMDGNNYNYLNSYNPFTRNIFDPAPFTPWP